MVKENSTQFWINSEIVKALEKQRDSEARVDRMTTYIENILNQYAKGKLRASL